MQDQLDPVDQALKSLAGRQWPGDYNTHEMKEKLMHNMQANRNTSLVSRRALVAALVAVVLGGAGFAAAGGLEMVQGWFITVEVNGVPVEVDDADIDIQTNGDGVTTITLDSADLDTGAEGDVATVTVTATQDANGTVTYESDSKKGTDSGD